MSNNHVLKICREKSCAIEDMVISCSIVFIDFHVSKKNICSSDPCENHASIDQRNGVRILMFEQVRDDDYKAAL